MLTFLADEHVAAAVVKGLRRRGVSAITLNDVGLLGAEDIEILDRAAAESWVILTQDQDFLRLHARGISHSGIVYAPQGAPIGDTIRGVQLLNDLLDSTDMQNHVEYL